MRTFLRARRRIAGAIPILGHYAAEGASALSRTFPKATPFVERALGKGLNWLTTAAQAVNFNPTFGTSPHTTQRYPTSYSTAAPEGTWETLEKVNDKIRSTRGQIPMGGVGAGPWSYFGEPEMHKQPRRGPPVSPGPHIPKEWTEEDFNIGDFPETSIVPYHAPRTKADILRAGISQAHKNARPVEHRSMEERKEAGIKLAAKLHRAPNPHERILETAISHARKRGAPKALPAPPTAAEKRAEIDRARRVANKARTVPKPGTAAFSELSRTKQKNARAFWSSKDVSAQQVI